MVNKKIITIQRECAHHIIVKGDFVMITTVCDFFNNANEVDLTTKYVTSTVSVINNNTGSQISKIGGSGDTVELAYMDFFKNWNRNLSFHSKENEILLCCNHIPMLCMQDIKPFRLTRTLKFSWKEGKECCILCAYIRKDDNGLIFTYDGSNRNFHADNDREIISFILANADFSHKPLKRNIRCQNSLFYPTTDNFIR